MKKYTVDGLLVSKYEMDSFIHDLANNNLDNLSAGSYRQVRLCYYKNGILLKSHHSTFYYCNISILSDKTAVVSRGYNNSRYEGNPNPKPDKGEFIAVWSDGKWVKEGPWESPIRELLAEAIEKLETRIAEREAQEVAQWEQREKTLNQKENQLKESWS